MGLDPSWMLGLQVAATQGKIFGQEFVSTYGPLGYLFIHADVNKAALLLYDLFVLFSLGSLYRALLPPKPAWLDCVQLILLAVITKACLWNGSPTVLFGLLCYWLWSVQEKGRVLSLVGTLIASVALFFGKANYGLVMVVLVPTYATALLIFSPSRRWHGMIL